jgi:hypothetical protein
MRIRIDLGLWDRMRWFDYAQGLTVGSGFRQDLWIRIPSQLARGIDDPVLRVLVKAILYDT